jgi:hypothetical protein
VWSTKAEADALTMKKKHRVATTLTIQHSFKIQCYIPSTLIGKDYRFSYWLCGEDKIYHEKEQTKP